MSAGFYWVLSLKSLVKKCGQGPILDLAHNMPKRMSGSPYSQILWWQRPDQHFCLSDSISFKPSLKRAQKKISLKKSCPWIKINLISVFGISICFSDHPSWTLLKYQHNSYFFSQNRRKAKVIFQGKQIKTIPKKLHEANNVCSSIEHSSLVSPVYRWHVRKPRSVISNSNPRASPGVQLGAGVRQLQYPIS